MEKTNPQHQGRTLREGRNCWKVETADRIGVVIDTADYFDALQKVCAQADHSLFILGWDFDRRERLGRSKHAPTLERFLYRLLKDHAELNIYLLLWDFNMIYAAERELFQAWHLRYNNHPRLHVRFDDRHPPGGSQHQKLVVADDAAAFCGGIDLSRWRWDTSEHKPLDPRRKDSNGNHYPPFHDLMLLVQGAPAHSLGELARERWRHSGSSLDPVPPQPGTAKIWPKGLQPLFENEPAAIARTFPAFGGRPEVREVEALFLDSVACAQRYIYIENQFFTSRGLTDALAERLREADGPEVILVLPHHTGGWLEQVTMDVLRQRQLQQLRTADTDGRLRVFYPHQPGLAPEQCISVHAKVTIIDDAFLHVGSANTSDRSMGLDSECDLAVENPEAEGARWLLHRLLAEHLDCRRDDLEQARESEGSLIRAVEGLCREQGRSLRKLDAAARETALDLSEQADLVDPDEPINPEYFVSRVIPNAEAPQGHRRLVLFALFIVLLLAVAAAWRWTPLAQWIAPDQLAAWLAWFEHPSTRGLAVLVTFVVASLLMVPLTILVVAAGLLLGAWSGFLYAFAGAMISALLAFLLGELMGGEILERLSGSHIHRLSKRLSERGIMAVAMLRLLPVAPFTIINLVAGASHIRTLPFMIGSAIGLLPGVLALTLFSGTLYEAVTDPSARTLGVLAVVGVMIVAGALGLKRLLKLS